MSKGSGSLDNHYIETPRGIFTSAGNWFHIGSETLDRYAPGLLKKYSLEELIKRSEVWIRSTDNIGILLFMILLYLSGIIPALLTVLILMPLWHINKSSFITIVPAGFLKIIDYEVILVLLSIIVISWMGIIGNYSSVVPGILVFCFLKFGWFRMGIEWAYRKMNRNSLLLNDRVLKMIVVKYALKEGLKIKELQAMEKEILKLIRTVKEKKNR